MFLKNICPGNSLSDEINVAIAPAANVSPVKHEMNKESPALSVDRVGALESVEHYVQGNP